VLCSVAQMMVCGEYDVCASTRFMMPARHVSIRRAVFAQHMLPERPRDRLHGVPLVGGVDVHGIDAGSANSRRWSRRCGRCRALRRMPCRRAASLLITATTSSLLAHDRVDHPLPRDRCSRRPAPNPARVSVAAPVASELRPSGLAMKAVYPSASAHVTETASSGTIAAYDGFQSSDRIISHATLVRKSDRR